MRLLEATTLRLLDFTPDKIPPYAILSHTWEEGEVLFEDIGKGTALTKSGYKKVEYTAQQALRDGLEYIWVDTCCINKESSAELSECLNSMFRWYQQAQVCYVYLADMDEDVNQMASCRWFTRGFTLQELIAPGNVVFFSRNWVRLGSKMDLCDAISDITGIGVEYLCQYRELECASIAQRMSWAANRQTSRPEDISYCLLGIFSVNMPLLYGEGARAFIRLEEEIMRNSDDQSLFAWCDPEAKPDALYGLLATSPAQFANSRTMLSYESWESRPPYAMTNRGLRIELPIQPDQQYPLLDVAALNCPVPDDPNDDTFIGVNIQKLSSGDDQYARTQAHKICHLTRNRGPLRTIYVRQPTMGPSTVFGGGGMFPHHIVVLGTGPCYEEQYHMISTLPPSGTTTKTFNTGPAIQHSGKEPKFLIDARAAARSWVPSHCRPTFSIPKSRKQLAGALLLKNGVTGSHICIMFGSMADYNIGFSAIDTEISNFIAPEASITLSEIQPLFSPVPPGRWIRLEHVSVRIVTSVHVFHGGKYFVLQLELAKKDQESQNKDDEHSASLPLSRGETYISPAVRPPSPSRRVIRPPTQPKVVRHTPKKPQKDTSGQKVGAVVSGTIAAGTLASAVGMLAGGF
ncbi:HET-domain-containing protein [Penicillium robsamsonii]|uniref:HET-domain-containing protein n=1 Tax=Penicillium robsamsonii TaxID=1792511 RepID=UPI002546F10E|nr:HET-domain-containing protein [Penicillium robsamsonii]KAJ5836566.1 HET-domain-containing protein [Penicillium robsamsonii]